MRILAGLLVGLVSVGARAQDAAGVTAGTIRGRVMFADTNGPARFAKVLLKPVVAGDPMKDLFGGLIDDDDDTGKAGAAKKKVLTPEQQQKQKASEAAAMKMMGPLMDMLASTTVGADGSYEFTNVKPGTYYVHAMAPGYVDPLGDFSSEELTSADAAVKAKVAAVATPVVVTGTQPGRMDLRLERGAAISGRVLYDDGTPAVGWTVRPVHAAAGEMPEQFSAMGLDASDMDLSNLSEVGKTDDKGNYRVAGLASGEYRLQARMTAGALGRSSLNPSVGMGMMTRMQGIKLTVYSGNVVRLGEAKTVSVTAGEEKTGYDLVEPLHLLHAVAGVVRSKDGAPVNAGTVQMVLQKADGKDDERQRYTAEIAADGGFRFDYVPGQSTYTVRVTNAADATTLSTGKVFGSTIAKQKTNRSYGPGSAVVVLGDGDVTDVKVEVTEVAAAGK